MLLSRSLRWKLLATGLSAAVLLLAHQVTVVDSRSVGRVDLAAVGPPEVGVRTAFPATAYCKGETTASGIRVRAGMVAGDPRVLPLGSVIQVDDVMDQFRGIYTVLDTGPAVKGRTIDVYVWSCHEALEFGRRQVTVTVLRRGWAQTGSWRP
jgi:3D (Asp-Asp-Asp) domain-containing protein